MTENYAGVLGSTTFWGEVANSTVAAVVTTIGVVALGLMASYVLAVPVPGRAACSTRSSPRA